MKPAIQKVRAAIAEHGLERQVIELDVHARTSQQAADALGVTVGQIVKSLVFTADGRPLLVVASGANRVDERRLGDLAGGKIRRADPDTVKQATGYTIGGVPPDRGGWPPCGGCGPGPRRGRAAVTGGGAPGGGVLREPPRAGRAAGREGG